MRTESRDKPIGIVKPEKSCMQIFTRLHKRGNLAKYN